MLLCPWCPYPVWPIDLGSGEGWINFLCHHNGVCCLVSCSWLQVGAPLELNLSSSRRWGSGRFGVTAVGLTLWIRLNLCNSRLRLCAVPFPRAAAPPGLGASSAEHSGPEQPLLLSSRVLWPWCAAPSWGSLSKGSLHVLPSVCFQGNVAGTQAGAAVEIWQRVPVRLQFQ